MLNPFCGRRNPELTIKNSGKDEIFVNELNVAKLIGALSANHVKWVWGSAWAKPNVLDSSLGIESIYTIPVKGYEDAEPTWKLPYIREYIAQSPKITHVAWIDDEIVQDGHDYINSLKIPGLSINPDPYVGITEAHVEKIRNFFRN